MQPARMLAFVFICLAAARCSSSVGTNQSAGTVDGKSFDVPYACAVYSDDPQDANTPGLVVLLSSSSSICKLQQTANMPKNSTLGQMILQTVANQNVTVPMKAATFSVSPEPVGNFTGDGNYVAFVASQLSGDAACYNNTTNVSIGTAGTVVVTNIGSRTRPTTGSYSVVLDGNNTLQGTFTAQPCIIPEAIWASNNAPTCE